MIASVLPYIVGVVPGVFIGLLIGGICNAAARADRAMDERIREEWQ